MDKNQDIPRIRKGDAFVQMEPLPLVFMEVNEVEGNAGNKDFCIEPLFVKQIPRYKASTVQKIITG